MTWGGKIPLDENQERKNFKFDYGISVFKIIANIIVLYGCV